MDNLSICSLNVRGLKTNLKRKTIIRSLKRQSYDVLALQETYLNDDEIMKFEKEMNLFYHHSSGIGRSKGLITVFSKKISLKDISLIYKSQRILISKIVVNDKTIFIINIYAPCADTDKIDFFLELRRIIEENIRFEEWENIICVGDFNTVRDNSLDIVSGTLHSQRTIDAFNEFIELFNCQDIWREQNLKIKTFTWSKPNMMSARRLDYILIGSNFLNSRFSLDTSFHSVVMTDHRAVVLNINEKKRTNGNNIFKLDNRLLKDEHYVKIIKQTIKDTAIEYHDLNPQLRWEIIKVEIKQKSEQYTKTYKRQQRLLQEANENRLKYFENELTKRPLDKKISNEICKIKKEMELKLIADTRAAATRAGVKWIQEGEKSNAFFLGLEKTRANSNRILSLNDQSGSNITDPTIIINKIKEYYTNLYKEEKTNEHINEYLDKFTQHLSIPKLNENDNDELEAAIDLDEMTDALRGMNAGSSPGIDGISTEFYKFFWIDIKFLVYESLMYAKLCKDLSISQRKGIFTLIHKGKDLVKDDLKNWRPISLMNVDYKLLTRVLAKRLQGVVSKIVHENQSGFIKGRQITKVLRELDDVIERDKFYKASNLLLAIDFEKAFDTISCQFIMQMCDNFGIGEYFGDWIRIVMNNRLACVKNNGLVSETFQLQRRIRQGCALSPLLFILAVELLAIKVRGDENIRGAKYGKYITKIRQYADDTTFLLRDEIDVREVLSRLKEFETFSGLRLNKSKSNIIAAGKPELIGSKIHGIEVCSSLKILGVHFSADIKAIENKLNWQNKIKKTKEAIKQWERRNLTIIGKILILKTFGVSNFVYLIGSIGMPDWVIKELNTCFFNFIWKNNTSKNEKATERVKRNIVCNDIHEGGLNMINLRDFQDGFTLSWIEQFLTEPGDTDWIQIPLENFEKIGGKEFFENNTEYKDIKGKSGMYSQFWVNALERWQKRKNNTTTDKVNYSDILFNNNKIKFRDSVILFPECPRYELLRVRDILQNDGSIMNFNEFSLKYENMPKKIMVYFVLLNALGRVQIMAQHENRNNPILFRDIEIGNIGRKSFMKLIKVNEKSFIIDMWKRKFDTEIENEHWINPTLATKETRLLVLQWKCLHNIYPTNIHLFKMKLKTTEMCEWCEEMDYSDHAFFECHKIKPLWTEIEKYFSAKTKNIYRIKKQDAMFGILKHQTNMICRDLNLLNHLILICKLTISKFRYGTRFDLISMLHRELKIRFE